MAFRTPISLTYRRQGRLLLLPYLLGTLLLVVAPALVTAGIAFTEYNGIRPPVWVGLDNFRQLVVSPLVRGALRGSVIFLLLAVPLRLAGALLAALWLRHPRRLVGVYRAAVFLPTIIPEAAYALLWLWLLNPVVGPLNLLLGAAGWPAPAWLAQPHSARLAMVLLSFFQLGEGFVLLLAGLQSIPAAVYDAATVDGAGRWPTFWYITLPLLAPWLLLLALRDLVMSLQQSFTPTFMMTYGGPYYATTFVPLLAYELAFDFLELGLAAALLLLTYLLLIALAAGAVNLIDLMRSPARG